MTSSASLPRADGAGLAIVTPSLVGSAQRAAFALASLQDLHARLGSKFRHIVVDDVPTCRDKLFGVLPIRMSRVIPNLAYLRAAPAIYSSAPNTEFIRNGRRGSLAAMLKALARARVHGCRYAFIHLDDNAYADTLPRLLGSAKAAMDGLVDLQLVRLSAYPLLTGQCTAELGNMTFCRREGDTVAFDGVVLHPVRRDGFTVWKSAWQASTADGNFWPVMLWNALYRVDFLERLLTDPHVPPRSGLGPVEAWYKTNWASIWRQLPGSFGFINMQFGGLERERNPNWRELLALPNRPIT